MSLLASKEVADGPSSRATLAVTLAVESGSVLFAWETGGSVQRGWVKPEAGLLRREAELVFQFAPEGVGSADRCGAHGSSIRALLRRVRLAAPEVETIDVGLVPRQTLGPAQAGAWHRLAALPVEPGWKWLAQVLSELTKVLGPVFNESSGPEEELDLARAGLEIVAAGRLGVPAPADAVSRLRPSLDLDLRILFDAVEGRIEWVWAEPESRQVRAVGTVLPSGFRRLTWRLEVGDTQPPDTETPLTPEGVRAQVSEWLGRFRWDPCRLTLLRKHRPDPAKEPAVEQDLPFDDSAIAREFIARTLFETIDDHLFRRSPLGRAVASVRIEEAAAFLAYQERGRRREEKRASEEAKRRAKIAELAELKRQRDEARDHARAAALAKRASEAKATNAPPRPPPRAIPPVPIVVRVPGFTFQEQAVPVVDLRAFSLREAAAMWWVSNQSDDLLCLPYCRIQRLEFQFRTALRVLGPLRGRALLSDEVGLGKTIEAGLVAKELFTRGLVKRLLVLTLPSLVDQWAEELEEKFSLSAATTNQPALRADADAFWRDNPVIVASLHTVKQPGQLAAACATHWDMLVVDEAHHLRTRTSQAWQAVNRLPRHFLLLLTATPVQNSLEELYNLVTLLQPGQLPSPKEFRARFIDPERPRQPREPQELRRLLGQVMIRNTRANAGIVLPPRQAETVVLGKTPAETEFWARWESDFRLQLAQLPAARSSLWGRLVLQALGSSPAAWRAILEGFPAPAAVDRWQREATLDAGWERKCEMLVPLVRQGNGAVVFSQFLDTQAALATFLRGAGVSTVVINGATPAADRQPLTEEFQRRGGALLLTQSGTEGRNLQFCQTLVNIDLPWNPMEIEQRIGRLHRLGQKHPVRIYNFVEEGTLQQHLLDVLQEKLNLFELVVGETGLVLGDRYSGDEFEAEVFQRWRDGEGRVGEAMAGLGEELAQARDRYGEVRQLDETLFADDFESR